MNNEATAIIQSILEVIEDHASAAALVPFQQPAFIAQFDALWHNAMYPEMWEGFEYEGRYYEGSDPPSILDLIEARQSEQQQQQPKRRRKRKVTLASALKQAKRASVSVKGAIIEDDKVTLQFGQPDAPDQSSEPNDYWDRAIARMTKQ
jgi:hypothetical protein